MSENTSANGVKFGFNKPDTNKEQQIQANNIPPVEKEMEKKPLENVEDLDEAYTDKRSITIQLVKNYSMYRKANDKVLPKRQDSIGSSILSSRTLCGNKEEIEAYFPNLIGVAVNDPTFITRVKAYWNNIKITVDEIGKTFDTSFRYHHKKDYYVFAKKEAKIEEEYKQSDRTTDDKIRKALKKKITDLNIMESEKHKFGRPVNLEDYLMYRHILLYNDIAKDRALVNSDPSIRFYLQDDVKEATRARQHRQDLNKAKINYVNCLSDDELFNAIYVQYCAMNNLPIISSMIEDRLQREINLDKFSQEEPVKFNKLFTNPDTKLIANIETLIARGELIRSQYNQNIADNDGNLIGANMKEALVWFKDPANASTVNAYINKLKNI